MTDKQDASGLGAMFDAVEVRPQPRKMWNYRCDLCFCNAPVYSDNNLCFACDHGDDEAYHD